MFCNRWQDVELLSAERFVIAHQIWKDTIEFRAEGLIVIVILIVILILMLIVLIVMT